MSQRNPNSLDLVCVHIEHTELPIEAYIITRKPIAEFDSGRSYMCFLCKQQFEKIMNNMEMNHRNHGMSVAQMAEKSNTKMSSHDHSKPMEDEEILMWKKNLLGAWMLTTPIDILMILQRIFELEILMSNERLMIIFILMFAFPVIFFFGWQTIKSGFRGLFTFY